MDCSFQQNACLFSEIPLFVKTEFIFTAYITEEGGAISTKWLIFGWPTLGLDHSRTPLRH